MDSDTRPALPAITTAADLDSMSDAALWKQISIESQRDQPHFASAAQAVLLARYGIRIDCSRVTFALAYLLAHHTLRHAVRASEVILPPFTDPVRYYDLAFAVPANCDALDVNRALNTASAHRSEFDPDYCAVTLYRVYASGQGIAYLKQKLLSDHGWQLRRYEPSAYQAAS